MVPEMSVFDDPYLNSKIISTIPMGDDSEQVLDSGHPTSDTFIGIDGSTDLKKSERYKLLKSKEVRHTVTFGYSGYGLFYFWPNEKDIAFIEFEEIRITKRESNNREKFYEAKGLKRDYILEVLSETNSKLKLIDGTVNGNKAIFMNHSCQPNSKFKEFNFFGTRAVFLVG